MSNISLLNKSRFELREPLRSFLTSLKNIFDADSCALYLINEKNIDQDEKIEEFTRKFPNGPRLKKDGILITNKSGAVFTAKDVAEYYVLKFIGVDDSYEDDKKSLASYWTFDYKNRPNKYIVCYGCHAAEHIYGEGITGLSARTKTIQHLSGKAIYDCPSRSGDDDTERDIHPKCKELISIPILGKNEEIVGVIRMDIYDIPGGESKTFKFDHHFSDEKDKDKSCMTINSLINEMCLQVVEISGKDSKEKSYDKLFNGINIIECIKAIKKNIDAGCKVDSDAVHSTNDNIRTEENSSKLEEGIKLEDDTSGSGDKNNYEGNKKIYALTRHLFYVFQRHTYIGYDEIMKRVMYYIEDVFDCLDMAEYYKITEGRLLKFRDHEQLMLYSTDRYRDHFMHQFHVFVLGYIFLNYIGIDHIRKIINKKLQNTSSYNKIEIDNKGVLRIWALITLFHDIAYIFEKYDKTMQKFISEQLFAEIPVHVEWGRILSDKHGSTSYIDSLRKMTDFFESQNTFSQTNKTELFRNYIQALQDNQDHGLISAILLINLFIPAIHKKYNNNNEDQNKRAAEVYLSALSISMHNDCVFGTLKESPENRYISFENFPFEFLLMYCDTIQEWGRKKEIDKVFYDAPILEKITLDTVDNKKSINCHLKYLCAEYPDENKLSSFLDSKISRFRSSDTVFGITYSYARRSEVTPFTFYRPK